MKDGIYAEEDEEKNKDGVGLTGTCRFQDPKRRNQLQEGVDAGWFCGSLQLIVCLVYWICNLIGERDDLHFDNAVIRADIQNLASKLMGQVRDCFEMFMLMS